MDIKSTLERNTRMEVCRETGVELRFEEYAGPVNAIQSVVRNISDRAIAISKCEIRNVANVSLSQEIVAWTR